MLCLLHTCTYLIVSSNREFRTTVQEPFSKRPVIQQLTNGLFKTPFLKRSGNLIHTARPSVVSVSARLCFIDIFGL